MLIVFALVGMVFYLFFQSRPEPYDHCLDKKNTKAKEVCLLNLAIDQRDVTICTRIQTTPVQFRCYVYMAALLERPDICTRITGSAISESKGPEQGDEQAGETVSWQFFCEYVTQLGFQGCYSLPRDRERRVRCLAIYAKVTGNVSLCDEISIKDWGGEAADCYTSIAETQSNISICDRITWDQEERSLCYSQLAISPSVK